VARLPREPDAVAPDGDVVRRGGVLGEHRDVGPDRGLDVVIRGRAEIDDLGDDPPDRAVGGPGGAVEIDIFSGRTVSSSASPGAAPPPETGTRIRSPGPAMITALPSETSRTVPANRLEVPMKAATNLVAGCS